MSQVILPTMSKAELQSIANNETRDAKNALNSLFGLVAFLREEQAKELPDDADEQLFYVKTLQREIDLIRDALNEARDKVVSAKVNLQFTKAALDLKAKLDANN